MIRRPPRSTPLYSSAASDVYKRQTYTSGSAVDTTVLQSSWNTDKLDGTGTSGVTLDTTKTNIFWIDFEWLGVGTVRYGVVVNGAFICCHKTHHANLLTLVYMSTPNLPIRWEIRTTGNAVDQLTAICCTVMCLSLIHISEPTRPY